MKKKINIILPVYNEADVIYEFNASLVSELKTLKNKYNFEVIYVLDRSTDNTIEILKRICDENENTRLIALSKRFGHQMSLVAGMDKCDGDAAIMMDSDLEHPPSVIPLLLEKYEEGSDIVYTKRTYNQNVSFMKRILSGLFYKILSLVSSVKIDENCADFRLISKKVLTVFKNDIREQNQFLRGLFPWVGFKQTSITFHSECRSKGKSKYNFRRLLNFATIGIISFSKTPLKFSILVGLAISGLSIAYGLYAVLEFLLNSKTPQGWTSLIATISFLGGLQLIVLGIIGEYIGSIYDEVKNRPLYIIDLEYLNNELTKE